MEAEETDAQDAKLLEMPEIGDDPFLKGIVPGTMSGAEMVALLEKSGAFEVWAEQYKNIGPGKKYADSTEYVQAMRARADGRSHG